MAYGTAVGVGCLIYLFGVGFWLFYVNFLKDKNIKVIEKFFGFFIPKWQSDGIKALEEQEKKEKKGELVEGMGVVSNDTN